MHGSNAISMKQRQYKTKNPKVREILEDGEEKAKKTRERQEQRKAKRLLWEEI